MTPSWLPTEPEYDHHEDLDDIDRPDRDAGQRAIQATLDAWRAKLGEGER